MSAPIFTALPPEGFRRTPWKNGGGVTTDIADAYLPGFAPGGWEGVVWRLGRTAITVPAPFSDLTGCERMQIVVVGSGLVLETPTGEIDLREPFRPVRYDGGTPIISRLENGPVEVVNLIADRTLCAIDLVVMENGAARALEAGIHVFYAPEGAVTVSVGNAAHPIAAGHALRIDAAAPLTAEVAAGRTIISSIRLN